MFCAVCALDVADRRRLIQQCCSKSTVQSMSRQAPPIFCFTSEKGKAMVMSAHSRAKSHFIDDSMTIDDIFYGQMTLEARLKFE